MKRAPDAPMLTVQNLRTDAATTRGEVAVVRGVSFSIAPGNTVGLVGESGCGKSMLARSIMGLLPGSMAVGQESRILFDGQDLLRLPAARLRNIVGRHMAIILQDPLTSLNPVMKIGRQIAEGLCHHLGVDRRTACRRAIALMDQVGIPMPNLRADQYPHQLSGGLCQRVAIAIALACKPKLLIADEPTTDLDVTVQAEILSLLDTLQKDMKMAMLLITHDLAVAAGRTDSTAVMYAGKIVEFAPTAALFAGTRMPYTKALIGAIPRLSDPPHTPLSVIDGQPPDPCSPTTGCRFAPRCRRATDRCRSEEPALNTIDKRRHAVACWHPFDTHGN